MTLAKIKDYISKGFDGDVEERRFISKEHSLDIRVLCSKGPYEDFISYSTYGVSQIPLFGRNGLVPFGIEVLSGAPLGLVNYPKVLVVIHEFFSITQQFLGPGNVLINAVQKAKIGIEHLPHLYFTSANYWGQHFQLLKEGSHEVRFIATFPISNAEYSFLKENGKECFEDLLIHKKVDIFNPLRQDYNQ